MMLHDVDYSGAQISHKDRAQNCQALPRAGEKDAIQALLRLVFIYSGKNPPCSSNPSATSASAQQHREQDQRPKARGPLLSCWEREKIYHVQAYPTSAEAKVKQLVGNS